MSVPRLLAPLAFVGFGTAAMAQTTNHTYVGDTVDMARAARENIEELVIMKDKDGFISSVRWTDLRLCDEATNPECQDIEKTFRLNQTLASKRFWHNVNPFKFLDKRTAGEMSQEWLDAAQKLNGCEGVPYRYSF
jgi:hypothetical protein